MIPYTFEIDSEDHVAARRLSLRPRRVMRRILWAIGLPILALLAWEFYRGVTSGRSHPFLPALLGGGIFLLVWYYVLLPRQIRRTYQPSHDTPLAPISGELSENGVRVTNAALTGAIAWPDVTHWKHDSRLILLFAESGDYTMIPLRGFATPAARDAALALLVQHLGPPTA